MKVKNNDRRMLGVHIGFPLYKAFKMKLLDGGYKQYIVVEKLIKMWVDGDIELK